MSFIMGPFRHILVPTDFEEASQKALALAAEIARGSGAKITVMHTCEIPVYPYVDTALSAVDLLSPVVDLAEKKLAEVMKPFRDICPDANSVLKIGVPADQILAMAADTGADLIVMGTHGRRGVSHALLGSVTEKIVRLSSVPVLTVRARQT